MKYTLGLDIGIASVGWCVLDHGDADGKGAKIANLGVRRFPQAEVPKDGSSLAGVRREAQSARRRLRRRRERLQDVRSLFVENGLASFEDLNLLFCKTPPVNPYQLRSEGLDRRLSSEEWIRVLFQIAKRRGFKSNRKSKTEEKDKKAKEETRLLAGVTANESLMKEKKYRTVGEMLANDEKFAAHKRNKQGDYGNTLLRSLLVEEVHILFDCQRKFGNPYTDSAFEERYVELFTFQLSFAAPGKIEKQVGFCTLEPEEKRAPRMSWTSERFMLLSKILNLRLFSRGRERSLDDEERKNVESLAYKNAKVTFLQLRKSLGIDDEWSFRGIQYGRKDSDPSKAEEKTFVELKGYHAVRRAVEKIGKPAWETLSNHCDDLDSIAYALAFLKTDEDIREYLLNHSVESLVVEAVLPLSFSKFANLSVKAMRRLVPLMEKGMLYSDACKAAGYNHSAPRGSKERQIRLLPPQPDEIRNPVVFRALAQTRKVVNAVVQEYGSPYSIHLELARDLSRPFDERRKIQSDQEENSRLKERIREEFKGLFNVEPRGSQLFMFRLWKEQGGFCAYSNVYLDANRVFFDPGYAEVDHVIPYSRSFDDSMSNKVLVSGAENRNKGNRTPFEYMGHDESRWNRFEAWVSTHIRNIRKRNFLLREELSADDESEMLRRNLSDTRSANSFAAAWLRDSLYFENGNDSASFLCVNGGATAVLRGKWGLSKLKDRAGSDLHHALDAAVVAAASPSLVKRISDYSRTRELERHREQDEKELRPRFPEPWPGFRHELELRLDPSPRERAREISLPNYEAEEIEALQPIFVSLMPRRKVTGAAHDDTIRSVKDLKKGKCYTKINLQELTEKKLNNMVGKERDCALYDALKERLKSFAGDAKKAFSEQFYKPTSDGKIAPIVRSIKIYDNKISGVFVRGGIAWNGDMVRVDVYRKNGKYYLVPHYIPDIAKNKINKHAITAGKKEQDWPLIDSSFSFKFSLFKGDLVKVTTKESVVFGYYVSTHGSQGTIAIETHDRSGDKNGVKEGVGVKTCQSFEKFQVDVLGRYHKVKSEPSPDELAKYRNHNSGPSRS